MKRTFLYVSTILLTISIGVPAYTQTTYTPQSATEDYRFLIKEIYTYNQALEIYNPDFN